jgi:hypothetical protein
VTDPGTAGTGSEPSLAGAGTADGTWAALALGALVLLSFGGAVAVSLRTRSHRPSD